MPYKITLKRPKDVKSSLMVQINKTGIPDKFYSGKSVHSKNWDADNQVVTKDEENYKFINNYIEDWERELRRIIEERESKKMPWNPPAIRGELAHVFNRPKIKNVTIANETVFEFIKFCQDNINETKLRGDKTVGALTRNKRLLIVSQGMLKKAELTKYESLSAHNKAKYDFGKIKPITAAMVNQKFLENFMSYMRTATYTVKKNGVQQAIHYTKNYIAKQLKITRQLIQKAINAKLVQHFPVQEFKSTFEEVDNIFTDFDQIRSFADLVFERNPDDSFSDEEIVRDYYVLNCFLGMRFSDLKKIAEHQFDKKRVIRGVKRVVFKGRQRKQIIL